MCHIRITIFLMRLITLILLFTVSGVTNAACKQESNRIAVIDTGFGYQYLGHEARLCAHGHKDFSVDNVSSNTYEPAAWIPVDLNGHGTNVAGIIDNNLRRTTVPYCIIVIKFYSDSQTEAQNVLATVNAFRYAISLKVNYINYSAGGQTRNNEEIKLVKQFIDGGGTFVAAAGNEGQDLGLPSNVFYPALDDPRIVVVGNKALSGRKMPSSNFGKPVTRWEVGESVEAYGIKLTGSSQAAAVATGKIVSERNQTCDR